MAEPRSFLLPKLVKKVPNPAHLGDTLQPSPLLSCLETLDRDGVCSALLPLENKSRERR